MDKAVYDKYCAVIGLEVHAQLSTQSKIFSADPNGYGGVPNSQAGVITLAHPGTLPKLNKAVIAQAIKMGLACHCDISRFQVFDRKNYFYPDLPKGYQITQDRTPICKNGYILIDTRAGEHKVRLNRIHLEEDAGKSIHVEGMPDTLVDYNRAGVPLIELVTEPVLENAEQAGALLAEIRKLVRYLDICDGNMEEGSLRCDANVSVRPVGQEKLGTRAEIKNVNSLRFLQKAIDYEIDRQIALLETGGEMVQETRLWNEKEGKTYTMRTKEDAHDYRYFPDPDLPALEVSAEWVQTLKAELPELPEDRRQRFMRDYELNADESFTLTGERALADYFEATVKASGNHRAAANWILSELLRELKNSETDIADCKIKAEDLGAMIRLIDDKTISGKIAKDVFADMFASGKAPADIVKEKGLVQITDTSAIEKIVDDVIAANPKEVEGYRSGKAALIGFFVGQVMKASGGKANPKAVNEILKAKLEA